MASKFTGLEPLQTGLRAFSFNEASKAPKSLLDSRSDVWLGYFKKLWKYGHRFEGLPDTIDPDALLEWLFVGNVLIAKVPNLDKPYMFKYAVDSLNYLGMVGKAIPVAPNPSAFKQQGFFSRPLKVDPLDRDGLQGVLFGTCTMTTASGVPSAIDSPYLICSKYATELAMLDVLERQNIRNNTHPVVLTGDGANDSNVKLLKEKLATFADSVVVLSTDLQGGIVNPIQPRKSAKERLRDLSVLDLGVSLQVNDIINAKTATLNEAYDWLGVNHLSMEKAERLTNQEVGAGNEATNAYLEEDWAILNHQIELLKAVFPSLQWRRGKEQANDIAGSAGVATRPAGKVGSPAQVGAPKLGA